ncbi:MAG: hypothetical protein WCO14_01590, partial [bacterium]
MSVKRNWNRTYQVGVILLAVCLLASCVGPTSAQQTPIATDPSSALRTPETTGISGDELLLVDQMLLNGKFEEAVLKLQGLQQQDPANLQILEKLRKTNAEWKYSEARLLMSAGGYEEAIKKIKTSLDLNPGDTRLLAALDEAYLGLGRKHISFLDAARAKEALLAVTHDQNLRLQAQSLLTLDVPAIEYTK